MKKIHHIVLVKFKPGTSEAAISDCFSAISEMKEKIAGLESISGGSYSSPEGLNQGFTHAFAMTFTNAAARDAYLPHPEHEKVKEMILPLIDDVVAFDYEM